MVKKPFSGFKPSLLAVAVFSASSAWAQNAENSSDAATEDADASVYEEVLVTGQRRSIETATDIKRESTTIGDSIVLDEAGKVPSTSLLEILERSPGITMNRVRVGSEGSPDGFEFEGSGIQVRGLAKTKTLVNGREIYSASGGSGLSFRDIGPELLSAVTTFKAARADLIEGGIAGTINLQTHMPFDFDGLEINGAASLNYGDFAEDLTPAASGMISNRWEVGGGEIGLLLDYAYSKIRSDDSNIIVLPYVATNYEGERRYAPRGIRYSADQFQRVRRGFYGALQWRPSENLEFFHTTFMSERETERDTQLFELNTTAPGVFPGAEFDSDNVFVRGGLSSANLDSGIAVSPNASFTPGSGKTTDYSTGFSYEGDGWDISGSYQIVEAESRSGKYSLGSTVIGDNVLRTEMDLSGSRARAVFVDPLSTDPADTSLSRINWLNDRDEGESKAIQLDGSIDISEEGFFRKASFGARSVNREESDNFVGTWWSATGRNWNQVPRPVVATAPEGDFELEEFSDFFKGDEPAAASAWVPTRDAMQQRNFERIVNTYAACGPDLHYSCNDENDPDKTVYLYGNPPDPNFDQFPSIYTTKHDTQSLYAMLGFANDGEGFLNFSGNLGVRWVNYEIESIGNFAFNQGGVFYASEADARASIEAMGGIENVYAWQQANPGARAPLAVQSAGYERNRQGAFSDDYILPSLNIKFEPIDDWVFRYAFSKSFSPPRYPDIRAQGVAEVQSVDNPINQALQAYYAGTESEEDDGTEIPDIISQYTFQTGNPFLKPEVSTNHDISIEWYPKRGSSAHLSLFHKSVEVFIIFNNFSAQASEFFAPEDFPEAFDSDGNVQLVDASVAGQTNINSTEDTTIKGFELGGQTYFDQLPGWLSGFGFSANYTYIDSSSPDSFALDMNGNRLDVDAIGMSKEAYSATLLYDYDKWSARLAWNWRGRYLTTVNDSGTTESYTDPFSGESVSYALPVYASALGRLDASVSYNFNDSLNFKVNVQNLTDVDQKTEMEILQDKFVDRAVFITDRRISFHVGYNF